MPRHHRTRLRAGAPGAREHRERLDHLARKLIEVETVDQKAFEALFSDLPPKEDLHGLPPRRHGAGEGGEPAETPTPAIKPAAKPKSSPAPNPA